MAGTYYHSPIPFAQLDCSGLVWEGSSELPYLGTTAATNFRRYRAALFYTLQPALPQILWEPNLWIHYSHKLQQISWVGIAKLRNVSQNLLDTVEWMMLN